VLFVNPRSGGGRAARAGVAERARERGVEVVVLAPGARLEPLAEEAVARGADALGVAGGDGSLAAVAAVAVAHDLPFICVPAGTRNHFALDLGLDPHEPLAALDAFARAVERRVDVAEVNGRTFLNTVSLGVYADAIHHAAYRDAKLRTLLATARARLGPSAEARGVRVVDDLGHEHVDPAIVLVSNDPYRLDPAAAPGSRRSLDVGVLGVLVVHAPRSGAHPPSRAWTAERLDVHAPATVPAGVDGEAVDLAPPLAFAVRPRALRVLVPARA
jgi:diacylglycerol kinase family enzyme